MDCVAQSLFFHFVFKKFINTLDTLDKPGVIAITDADEFKVWKIPVIRLKS